MTTQSLGDLAKHGERQVSFTSFNPADVGPINISLGCQFLLRPLQGFPFFADSIS